MELIDELLQDADERMGKSVESTRGEFATVRTGRASPHLLDRVDVDYYGAVTPLRQLAQISATEARLLTITPYDKSSIKAIEKAILESDVGLTPSNDGQMIRLAIPALTRSPMPGMRPMSGSSPMRYDVPGTTNALSRSSAMRRRPARRCSCAGVSCRSLVRRPFRTRP